MRNKQSDLRERIQMRGRTSDKDALDLNHQYNDAMSEFYDLSGDVSKGELLAYGVPGVALATGSVIGGRALSNAKKKKNEQEDPHIHN